MHSTRGSIARTVALVAPLGLLVGLAPPPVSADQSTDCNSVPLRYALNHTVGKAQFATRARLRVHDLCAAGSITGSMGIKGRNGTKLRNIDPVVPLLAYKRESDTGFKTRGVDPIDRVIHGTDRYRDYAVSTADIAFASDGGYFLSIRLRWRVQVGGHTRRVTVICDRIHDTGPDSYLCGTP